jgi:hypothetical protein
VEASSAKSRLGYGLLAIWALVGLVGIGSLAVSHTVALPPPDEATKIATAALLLQRDPDKAFVVHVIYADCSCTQRLFAHLLKRGPRPAHEELILFVGRDTRKQEAAEARGYRFQATTNDQLASRFGLESAPVLMVFDRKHEMRYIGGYFDSPAAQLSLDEKILDQPATSPLPVFGCAVSPKLQKTVDPLGIVY